MQSYTCCYWELTFLRIQKAITNIRAQQNNTIFQRILLLACSPAFHRMHHSLPLNKLLLFSGRHAHIVYVPYSASICLIRENEIEKKLCQTFELVCFHVCMWIVDTLIQKYPKCQMVFFLRRVRWEAVCRTHFRPTVICLISSIWRRNRERYVRANKTINRYRQSFCGW